MDSKLSYFDLCHKAEVATMIEILRKRTTRNVPLAGFYLTIAIYLLVRVYCCGTTIIGYESYVNVDGLVSLALALCLIYAASLSLIVRTTDKALKLLFEEMFKDHAETRILKNLNAMHDAHTRSKAEHVVPPDGP